MTNRSYAIYDVFTDQALAGNPLAVVLDGEGLSAARMQAIAREFNLSETTFVAPPSNPRHSAAVRIFTPDHEMPFAGHPTVGTAVALAERSQAGGQIVVLEETIGPVRCVVSIADGAYRAEFDLPKLPEKLPLAIEQDLIGAALGLGPLDIGFENHRVGLWSAGVRYVTVPVAGLDAIGRVRLDKAGWLDIVPPDEHGNPVCPYIYCRETLDRDCAFHARMIVPGQSVWEDPATGSAAAAFAGAVAYHDRPVDGPLEFRIEQGIEMGRPSQIRLALDIEGGTIVAARIGGHAVKVAEGTLFA
jgi:trans-2,3-dihydro-3-hydroxyanthranilate isomerase